MVVLVNWHVFDDGHFLDHRHFLDHGDMLDDGYVLHHGNVDFFIDGHMLHVVMVDVVHVIWNVDDDVSDEKIYA